MVKKSISDTEILLRELINGMQEVKAKDIVVLDLKKINHAMADYFVVCHGSSSTQVEAISRSVEKETLKSLGVRPAHIEGSRNAQWILMDYFDVIVHIFNAEAREFYSIEELWADAEFIRVEETV